VTAHLLADRGTSVLGSKPDRFWVIIKGDITGSMVARSWFSYSRDDAVELLDEVGAHLDWHVTLHTCGPCCALHAFRTDRRFAARTGA
jgi:hypothetical protein